MLGVRVIETSALKGMNIDELVSAAREAATSGTVSQGTKCFTQEVENALTGISSIIEDSCDPETLRWYSIKVLSAMPRRLSRCILMRASSKHRGSYR